MRFQSDVQTARIISLKLGEMLDSWINTIISITATTTRIECTRANRISRDAIRTTKRFLSATLSLVSKKDHSSSLCLLVELMMVA